MGEVKNVGLCLFLGILSVIFLLLSALGHFRWIDKYVQKYGRATSTSALNSCDL